MCSDTSTSKSNHNKRSSFPVAGHFRPCDVSRQSPRLHDSMSFTPFKSLVIRGYISTTPRFYRLRINGLNSMGFAGQCWISTMWKIWTAWTVWTDQTAPPSARILSGTIADRDLWGNPDIAKYEGNLLFWTLLSKSNC